MFLLSGSFQPQLTVLPLINALHSLKNTATASIQTLHKELIPEQSSYLKEPNVILKDLGLSELKVNQLDELISRLVPTPGPEEPATVPHAWRTSHVSANSFFHNKHGFSHKQLGVFGSPMFHRQHHSPLKVVCSELHFLPVLIQSRGFKTLPTKPRRTEYESEHDSLIKSYLLWEKHLSPNQQADQKNLSENQQEAYKMGFAEGVIRFEAHNQRTKDSYKKTKMFGKFSAFLVSGVFVFFIYWFLSGRGSLSDAVRNQRSALYGIVDPVEIKNVTFDHVKGVEEAKNELQDVVEFLKNPQKFTVLGGRLPKGVLLIGPPGTGKTLLARAVAGEADVPFYYTSGSQFDEMYVGTGATRIRKLFKEAKANAPSVIFIDELDSVGGKRIDSGLHPYSRQTINQLLAEMDGFKPNEGVLVVGATNMAEALDGALMRPGRFDMKVTVPRPDVKGRIEILNWYLDKIKMDPAVDTERIARGTVGFSGADLENLVNQAALKAAVDDKTMVGMKDLDYAKDKILMGPERRSVEIDSHNQTITAYHESGHAIVAYFTKDALPIHKATIMPRGPTLGHVSLLPSKDQWSETRSQLLAQMDVNMGGRVAEELIFGDDQITTGGSSDFDGATRIARMMVTRYGMSDKLGIMTYNDVTKQSPETQAAIEKEIRALLDDSYARAKNLLKTYSKEHKTLADALLRNETLDAKEIKLVLEGKSLDY